MRRPDAPTPPDLPPAVAEVVDVLAALPGTVAVALGGSRARGVGVAGSDWDLGLYYRGAIDLAALAARGTVHPPGAWGRVMNGGAWLRVGGEKVDVLLRDLDAVEAWAARAERGEFEIDALLGYVAGIPTYTLAAELAMGVPLRGALPAAPYPRALATAGPPRWRFCRAFSVEYARAHARRGDVSAAVGQAAKAVAEEAHARLCERGRWVCNEKGLAAAAGLDGVQPLFARVPPGAAALGEWVDGVAAWLAAPGDTAAPWSDAGRGG